jgi:hypothetical protein
VTFGTEYVKVELRSFHDRALNRDLAEVCTRVAKAAPLLPDGRRLLLCLQQGVKLFPQLAQVEWDSARARQGSVEASTPQLSYGEH